MKQKSALDLILVVDWYEVLKEYPISVPATNGKKKHNMGTSLVCSKGNTYLPIQH